MLTRDTTIDNVDADLGPDKVFRHALMTPVVSSQHPVIQDTQHEGEH